MAGHTQFMELLQPNLVPLKRFVFRIVGNHFDGEDIVQETVIKAFIHFADFRAESKFQTWLMSIAMNEVRIRRRTEYRSRVTYFDLDQLERLVAGASTNDSPYLLYQDQEATQLVQNAMVSLRHTNKEIIQLTGHRWVEHRRHSAAAFHFCRGREIALLPRGSSTVSYFDAAGSQTFAPCR